jgi:hypothetical protein
MRLATDVITPDGTDAVAPPVSDLDELGLTLLQEVAEKNTTIRLTSLPPKQIVGDCRGEKRAWLILVRDSDEGRTHPLKMFSPME